MKTNELSGAALDWAVAKCEFPELVWGETIGLSAHARDLIVIPDRKAPNCYWQPSTNWAQGGPIIEREEISVAKVGRSLDDALVPHPECWVAHIDGIYCRYGVSALIAAMRCYVASKLGDEVQLPEGLK